MKNATEQQATQFAGVFVQHHQLLTSAPKEDLQWAIQNGREALSLFVNALINRTNKTSKVLKKTLIFFITIQTGNTTVEKLIADIKANKNKNDVADDVSSYAGSMMANSAFTISKERGTADLAALSIAELGFTENPGTDEFMTPEFCARWSAENLDGYVIELCQPEDGPQLRKQWKDQPKDTAVLMAMERIAALDGIPRVFYVGCHSDGLRWLFGFWALPDHRWDLGDRIVFRLRKITQD